MNMECGQRVYVQKDELVFHKWYEAHIVEIRTQQRPAAERTPFWCLCEMTTVCSKLPLEYVVRYSDDTTQVVPLDRILERD
jgi:hypothetical protein